MFSYVSEYSYIRAGGIEAFSSGTDLISLFTNIQIKSVSKSEYFQKAQIKKVSNLSNFLFTRIQKRDMI